MTTVSSAGTFPGTTRLFSPCCSSLAIWPLGAFEESKLRLCGGLRVVLRRYPPPRGRDMRYQRLFEFVGRGGGLPKKIERGSDLAAHAMLW